MSHLLVQANALRIPLADKSVHMCVTSPPYWGLRDYGVAGQLGLEPTPDEFIRTMTAVFREVWRVLRDDGTLWVNIGDSYAAGKQGQDSFGDASSGLNNGKSGHGNKTGEKMKCVQRKPPEGLKPKDLCGIPWALAKALQSPYYTGQIHNELDRVWLAATIDAEGTICGFTHHRKDDGRTRTGINVNITNTAATMLEKAMRIWPASQNRHQKNRAGHFGTMETFRWNVQGVENKIQLLRELYPYFVVKRRQAMVAYNLLLFMRDAKKLGKSSELKSIHAKRATLIQMLTDLNHSRPVDIPSWCQEPPPCWKPGWYLRSDIIWSKPNPMPESVTDRPTKSHEYLFLLSKQERYYFDSDAVREEESGNSHPGRRAHGNGETAHGRMSANETNQGRNIRSVWNIPTESYPGSHFATYPRRLVEPCIKAGTSERGCCPVCSAGWVREVEKGEYSKAATTSSRKGEGDAPHKQGTAMFCNGGGFWPRSTTGWRPGCSHDAAPVPAVVLDPFSGSGTTGVVANVLGRSYIGLDLNREYIGLAQRRIARPHAPVVRPGKEEHHPLFGEPA